VFGVGRYGRPTDAAGGGEAGGGIVQYCTASRAVSGRDDMTRVEKVPSSGSKQSLDKLVDQTDGWAHRLISSAGVFLDSLDR
jgi:hypothetical protein